MRTPILFSLFKKLDDYIVSTSIESRLSTNLQIFSLTGQAKSLYVSAELCMSFCTGAAVFSGEVFTKYLLCPL